MNVMSPVPMETDPGAGDKQLDKIFYAVDIQWGVSRDAGYPDDSQLIAWVVAALDALDSEPVALCVRMMDEREIAGLNLRYRNKAAPTNVLSFHGEGHDEAGRTLLGDLALCTGVISREAVLQHKSLAAHTAHMLVHGILHLSGYDHENDEDASQMERVEVAILKGLGFDDPYMELAVREENDHE